MEGGRQQKVVGNYIYAPNGTSVNMTYSNCIRSWEIIQIMGIIYPDSVLIFLLDERRKISHHSSVF
jgi:hypothetical protein